jgi:hypothetical protein
MKFYELSERYALKKLNISKIDEPDFKAYEEEVNFLRSNPNSYVVEYIDCFRDKFVPHIVTKYYAVSIIMCIK